MAIDQKNIAINACIAIVRDVSNILKALDDMESIQEQLTAAGVDISSFVVDIEGDSRLKHCDASTFKNVLTMAADVVTHLKANYTGSPTQQAWTAFQKARSALTFGPL